MDIDPNDPLYKARFNQLIKLEEEKEKRLKPFLNSTQLLEHLANCSPKEREAFLSLWVTDTTRVKLGANKKDKERWLEFFYYTDRKNEYEKVTGKSLSDKEYLEYETNESIKNIKNNSEQIKAQTKARKKDGSFLKHVIYPMRALLKKFYSSN